MNVNSVARMPVLGNRLPVKPRAPLAPVLGAKARAADPLPTFRSSDDYKSYVINLVAQSRATESDLKTARAALNEGKAFPAQVATLQERQDAIKLQLSLLRDQYAVPAEWSRPRWLGGQAFDQPKFWHEQVEAIPGKEVAVTPKAPVAAPIAQPAVRFWQRAPQAPQATAGVAGKIGMANLAYSSISDYSQRDATVLKDLRASYPLMANFEDVKKLVTASCSMVSDNTARDQFIAEAVAEGLRLAKWPGDAIALAGLANKNMGDYNLRNNAVVAMLTGGVALAKSTRDIEAIVKAARDEINDSTTRDAFIQQALGRAGQL